MLKTQKHHNSSKKEQKNQFECTNTLISVNAHYKAKRKDNST